MQINATQTTPDPAAPAAASSKTADQLANKETFLQLLVAQLKNQDPLNPADGAEFLGQLTQFSQLEQLIAIRSDIKTMSAASTTTPEPEPAA